MKRDFIDFFYIEAHQLAIHQRLENWARTVEVWRGRGRQHPMWLKSRSKTRQWHEPDLRPPTDTLDGHVMEKAVAALPIPHRDALRWNYVHKGGPLHQARKQGVTKEGLMTLVRDARQMLINRNV
jgi:hypothetical protein